LKCKDVMEPGGKDSKSVSKLSVSEDAIIETVAEAVLNESKPVPVKNDAGKTVGVLNRKSIVHVLFGKEAH